MSDRFERQVYLLSPRQLSPETIAVAFAKTSRSPLSFRQIAAELSEKQSAEFHEKWVVGYGHASVAEHAVLHLAFENVSRLAVECLESNRLASYTEKSTRYQKWDPEGFYIPEEVIGGAQEGLYREVCARLFASYHESLEPLRKVVQGQLPRREGESDERWDGRIRSRYVDACRYLLPTAALANVGMTANARVLEHALRKMLAHPLAEVRAMGQQARAAAQAEVPTLLKYADPTPYAGEAAAALAARAAGLDGEGEGDWLRLAAHDPQGELRVLAAALYAQTGCAFDAALDHVRSLDGTGRQGLAEDLLGAMGRFDVPLRALEHAVFTVEVVLDQGAYAELKRHRLMTQTPQRLTALLGYAVPRLFTLAGREAAYRQAMQAAGDAYRALAAWNPEVAAYVVPNGFKRRVLLTLNLREAFHFCELRSAANAHFAIRRVALRLAEALREASPRLGAFLRLPEGADWRALEAEHFTQA